MARCRLQARLWGAAVMIVALSLWSSYSSIQKRKQAVFGVSGSSAKPDAKQQDLADSSTTITKTRIERSNRYCTCTGVTVVAVTALGEWEITRKTVASFLQSVPIVDVRFYNDGSIKDAERCRKSFPTVHVINGTKHGLTALWNLAFQHFLSCECHKFFVISNNDVVVPRGLLREMSSVMGAIPADALGPLTTRQGLGGRGNYDPEYGHGFYLQQDISRHLPAFLGVQTNSELLELANGSLEEIQGMLIKKGHIPRKFDVSLTRNDVSPTEELPSKLTKKIAFSQRAAASPGGLLGFFLMFERHRATAKLLPNYTLFDARNLMTGQESAIVGPPQFMRCYVCTTCVVVHEKGGTFEQLALRGKKRDNLTAVYHAAAQREAE